MGRLDAIEPYGIYTDTASNELNKRNIDGMVLCRFPQRWESSLPRQHPNSPAGSGLVCTCRFLYVLNGQFALNRAGTQGPRYVRLSTYISYHLFSHQPVKRFGINRYASPYLLFPSLPVVRWFTENQPFQPYLAESCRKGETNSPISSLILVNGLESRGLNELIAKS